MKQFCYCLILSILMTNTIFADFKSGNALITVIQGEGSYLDIVRKSNPIKSLLKLNEGDKVKLESEAKLQLVYLETGEVENWRGPASFAIGSKMTTSVKQGTPERKKIPSAMLERISRTSEVMSDLRNRTGMVVLKSFDQTSKTVSIEDKLALVDDIEPDLNTEEDITGSLALFNQLYIAGEFETALHTLEKIRTQFPNDRQFAEASKALKAKLKDH